MPEEVVAAQPGGGGGGGGEAGAEQPAGRVDGWGMFKSMMTRLVIIYFISSMIRNWRGGPPTGANNGTKPSVSTPSAGRNLFPKGTEMDFYVYLSESEKFIDFDNQDALFWTETGLVYGDWTTGPNKDGSFTYSGQIPAPPSVQNNGSLFIHVYIVKAGKSPNPRSPDYSKRAVVYHSRRLNKYKKKKYQQTQNLLTGKTEKTEEEVEKAKTVKIEILNHWHPNLTFNLIDDHTAWTPGALPSPLDEAVKFDHHTGNYWPIFFFNDYWNLAQEYQLINETVSTLNLTLTFAPMSLFKWQMYASQQMRNKWTQLLGSELVEESDEDQDSLKQAILETNPYLLGATIAVSILHTIFEFLAFKNDIQFWRSRKSLEGLSVRSVLFNCLTSLIVLLYIMDNETNFVVRISVFIGLLIELWKVPKCMDVSLDRENPLLGVIPRIRMKDKGSYVESSTRQYDIMAFKYLGIVCFPLIVGYGIYSLVYVEHRGWYSFVLGMMYGFLLTFGFIMMTPQLFINYKLKSVAHLPWRMLSYKFLNTFIDDIFAFVIKMPTMYRIGCFRDDIVFLIFLYQRWIYRVDPTRINEFGTSGEMHAELEQRQNGEIPPAVMEGDTGDDETPQETKKDK